MIFLTHPSTVAHPVLREEIQRRACNEDLIYVLQGPALRSTGIKHSDALAEFARWAKGMIASGKQICIELTVRPEYSSDALCLKKLQDAGLDIFGEHQDYFSFQGGLCGAKAFTPEQFAG